MTFQRKPYATGKIMKPNWEDCDGDGILDCWDGFSNGGVNQPAAGASTAFYPIIVQIPEGIPLNRMTISFEYDMADLLPANGQGNPPSTGDGAIRIWKKNGTAARNGLTITAGGDFVMSTGTSVSYTPQ